MNETAGNSFRRPRNMTEISCSPHRSLHRRDAGQRLAGCEGLSQAPSVLALRSHKANLRTERVHGVLGPGVKISDFEASFTGVPEPC